MTAWEADGERHNSEEELKYILLTDIADSSKLGANYPQLYRERQLRHNQLVLEIIGRHGGEKHLSTGDGYWAIFNSAYSAAQAAIDIQRALHLNQIELTFPDGCCVMTRCILDCGRLTRGEDGWQGQAFVRAARLEAMAYGGQVLMSGEMQECLFGNLPEGAEVVELGRHWLRGVTGLTHVWQLNHSEFVHRKFPEFRNRYEYPTNMFHDSIAFFGRERELEELTRKVLQPEMDQIVTIVGPGGYGKTRLAIKLLQNIRQEHRDLFPDGIWQINLAGLPFNADQEQVAKQAIVEILSEKEQMRLDSALSPLIQLSEYFRRREAVILFDNFEHVSKSATLLREIAKRAPSVKLVVTSREVLPLHHAFIYDLGPLPVGNDSPSLQLFMHTVSMIKPRFEWSVDQLATAGKLCIKLSGIPLVLELMAAWADTTSLEEMLNDASEFLNIENSSLDIPMNHRSLAACNEWSWNLLAPELQQALAQLCVFCGGWFAEDVPDVLYLSNISVRLMLSSLRKRRWLNTEEIQVYDGIKQTRYSFVNLDLEEFARSKMPLPEEKSRITILQQRHMYYFARQSSKVNEELQEIHQKAAYRWFRLQRENIEVALQSAFEIESTEMVDKLELGFGNYLQRVGEHDSRLRVHHMALEMKLEQWALEEGTHSKLVSPAGILPKRTLPLRQQAIDQSHRIKRQEIARSQLSLGNAYARRGDLQNARLYNRKGIEVSIESRYCHGLAYGMSDFILLKTVDGEFETWVNRIMPGIEWARKEDAPIFIASVLEAIGDGYRIMINPKAVELYSECLDIYHMESARQNSARVLYKMGAYYRSIKEIPRSIASLSEALTILPEAGQEYDRGQILLELTQAYLDEGDVRLASQLCNEWHQIYLDLNQESEAVNILFRLSVYQAVSGFTDEARTSITKAIHALSEIDGAEKTRTFEQWSALLEPTESVNLTEITHLMLSFL